MPSIALHYNCGGTSSHRASVTMLESQGDWSSQSLWKPVAAVVDVDDGTQLNGQWAYVNSGVAGHWDSFNLAFVDMGPCTDIVALQSSAIPGKPEHNNYFAAFCNSVEDSTANPASAVNVAYGDASDYVN